MKIVIDNKIPFIHGVFEPHAEVVYLPGGEIGRSDVEEADCLIVRTRTRCNEHLLKGSRVQLIGTATIGFDHLDTAWLSANGIRWSNAPGCNSGSVAQYVTAALLEMADRQNFTLKGKTLGIIGVGNVGRKVERIAGILGMKVLLNDPPRERAEGPDRFCQLADLLKHSDIITVHVPLNREGPDQTHHLIDGAFISGLKPGTVLINSSRGEVVNEQQVLKEMRELRKVHLVLDVWENEPEINPELLNLAAIATPHIAGYSQDGKLNATRIMVGKVFSHFRLSPGLTDPAMLVMSLPDQLLIPSAIQSSLPGGEPARQSELQSFVKATYDIVSDDRRLRESHGTFEKQRNNYPVRREFNAWAIDPFPEKETGRVLAGLGFKKVSDTKST